VIFLTEVGENLAQSVIIAMLTAFFHRFNVGDNVNDVLLQDVALAVDSAWTLRQARDTLLTGNKLVSADFREEGAGERKKRS